MASRSLDRSSNSWRRSSRKYLSEGRQEVYEDADRCRLVGENVKNPVWEGSFDFIVGLVMFAVKLKPPQKKKNKITAIKNRGSGAVMHGEKKRSLGEQNECVGAGVVGA